MSSSKKLTCKETLWQEFICLRPRTPFSPPPRIPVFSILIHTGKGGRGGRVEPERRGEGHRGEYITKLG